MMVVARIVGVVAMMVGSDDGGRSSDDGSRRSSHKDSGFSWLAGILQ